MHTVIETADYLQDAKDVGLSREEMAAIIEIISSDPEAGDVMVGTGGARKLRFEVGGTGKRGGVRTVHYFGSDDVPVFMAGQDDGPTFSPPVIKRSAVHSNHAFSSVLARSWSSAASRVLAASTMSSTDWSR